MHVLKERQALPGLRLDKLGMKYRDRLSLRVMTLTNMVSFAEARVLNIKTYNPKGNAMDYWVGLLSLRLKTNHIFFKNQQKLVFTLIENLLPNRA